MFIFHYEKSLDILCCTNCFKYHFFRILHPISYIWCYFSTLTVLTKCLTIIRSNEWQTLPENYYYLMCTSSFSLSHLHSIILWFNQWFLKLIKTQTKYENSNKNTNEIKTKMYVIKILFLHVFFFRFYRHCLTKY